MEKVLLVTPETGVTGVFDVTGKDNPMEKRVPVP